MKSLVPFLHQTCRNAVYPRSNVKRFSVPDHLVNWSETYAEYMPVFYESPHISAASWADPAIGSYKIHYDWLKTFDEQFDWYATGFIGIFRTTNESIQIALIFIQNGM